MSLRLTPAGELYFEDGKPSPYATGHGDLPEALRKSGLLERFLASRGDGYVWIANLDNLGAISRDGRIVTGTGADTFDGTRHAWIVELPP